MQPPQSMASVLFWEGYEQRTLPSLLVQIEGYIHSNLVYNLDEFVGKQVHSIVPVTLLGAELEETIMFRFTDGTFAICVQDAGIPGVDTYCNKVSFTVWATPISYYYSTSFLSAILPPQVVDRYHQLNNAVVPVDGTTKQLEQTERAELARLLAKYKAEPPPLIVSKPPRSILEQWRVNLKVGDRAAVWDADRELLVCGTLGNIEWGDIKVRIELIETFKDCTYVDTHILEVELTDILPKYCDKRSDAWRFNYRVGSLISWRDPNCQPVSRTDWVQEITYDISKGELLVLLGDDSEHTHFYVMDLVELSSSGA
jgi:hypothetical protein